MGPKCHTEDGEFWESYIDGRYEGFFTIDEVSGGTFSGLFNDDLGDPINGSCTGARIEFTRTALGKDYSGIFTGGGSVSIRGVRSGHKRDDEDKGGRPDDETWDGTKTGGHEDEPKNRRPLRKNPHQDRG
jgi:hypothetical protein